MVNEKEETLEQKVIRLETEKTQALAGKVAAEELALESSSKLKKLEGIKTEATVEVGDEIYKVLLKKFALKTVGSPIAKKFHLVKDEKGNVHEDHHYPTDEELIEIVQKKGILEKL